MKELLPDGPTDQEIEDKLKEIESNILKEYISLKELLKDLPIIEVPIAHQHNLEILRERMNSLREVYGHPMHVTSGYRTEADQLRIYRERGVPDHKIPMNSQHLKGGACDILDRDGSLMKWTRENEQLLVDLGLWVEDDPSQPRVHYQINPPKSGNRFFKP